MKTSVNQTLIKRYIKSLKLEHIFKSEEQLQLLYFESQECVIEENTEVKYLYLVLEGQLRVSPSSAAGRSGLLEFILPMDVIGDIEYFSKDKYYHGVEALSACIFLAIPVSLIESQYNDNVYFYKFICENLANKMKRTSQRYSSSLIYPLRSRIAGYLYDLAIIQDNPKLKLNLTQTAEYFGVTPRHLRRVLSELESSQLIMRSRSIIHLIDMKNLQAMLPPKG